MTTDAYVSLTGLTAAYHAGGAKPTEVVGAHLDRISQFDPTIGAYQVVYADDAIAQAEAADRMIATGQSLGPFHGIPFALKDICDVEGRITTGGSKVKEDRISQRTGTIARRLMAAGGILLGKTKTVESALGGWGTNQHMGTPRNPWDMLDHRIPGGSSSGTGAAVASGMAICGVGTDTGGSVRLPAGYCGLVGLKVTEGHLPTDGIMPLSHTLDTPGPMARSVADAAIMYHVMDGMAGADLADQIAKKTGTFSAMTQGVNGMRLGILNDAERDECSAEVLAGYDRALAVLEALGAELAIFDATAPYAQLTVDCGKLVVAEAWYHHGALYAQPDLPLDEDVRGRMLAGRDVSAASYMGLLASRQTGKAAFLERMQGFDALLTPSMTTTAPRLRDVDQDVMPSHFTRHVNFFGLCALSVPSGLSAAGLPTSLQIIARPYEEQLTLRIGAAYEAARGRFDYPCFSALN